MKMRMVILLVWWRKVLVGFPGVGGASGASGASAGLEKVGTKSTSDTGNFYFLQNIWKFREF